MKTHIHYLILLFSLNLLNAQKISFINETILLKSTPNYEQSVKQMDSIKKVMQEEVKLTKNKLITKSNDLLKPYNFTNEVSFSEIEEKLTDIDKKKLELLKEENLLLDKQVEAKEKEFQAIYKEKVGAILEKVNKTVKEYCKKNEIELLYKVDFLQPAIAYYDESKDLTEVLIKLVK